MRRKSLPFLTLALAMLVGALALSTAAEAGSRELKDTGVVGESINGYLAIIPNTRSAGVGEQIEAINAQRRQVYLDAAAKTGRPLAEIEAVAGARLRDNATPGDWVQNAAGDWIRKP